MSKRVLIGMSGGIDSTVAAILLLEQGYELVGATFRTFDPTPIANTQSPISNTHPSLGGDGSRLHCASEQSILDAQRMAATLGFEHHILDFRDTFREHVIGNFVSEYACGRTPNPCVMCNSHIKWGKLMQAAEQYGCDYIATGHYAQIAEHRGHMYLKTAVDTHKDQTYFLWMLTEENLRRTIFPLGGLTKAQVRQIAFDHGFEALSKKEESQDICFIPNNDYRSFLAQHGVSVPQGEYVDAQGKILGMHQGYCHYTIGQRKGLGIALGAPKFVTKIDAAHNRVTLGDREDLLTTEAVIADVRVRDWEWLQESPELQARIRYKSPAVPAHLSPISNTQSPIANTQSPISNCQSAIPNTQSPIANTQSPISNCQSAIPNTQSPISNCQSPIANTQSPIANTQSPIANTQSPIANTPTLPEEASLHFVSPVWGVTPGQSLVMYKDGLVVGGGIIQ